MSSDDPKTEIREMFREQRWQIGIAIVISDALLYAGIVALKLL